jgi:hypothetical protein
VDIMAIRKGKKSLASWLDEAMSDQDKDGSLSMIALVHMVGLQQKELHVTRFSSGKQWSPKDLATMFQDKAETYAQDLPGIQTFQLLAFYGKDQPEAYLPFTINQNIEPANGLGTEPPNEQGQRQQSMRHTEMLLSQVYRRQQVMDDHSMRMIERQGSMIERLVQENQEAFSIMKEMMMEAATQNHERRMRELEFERSTAERKKWLSYAPALLNTVLGREIFPQSTADTALIEAVADSLTEEDMMKLASTLKPELMGPLAHRLTQYMQKKNREAEEAKKLAQLRSPDPENDAAGEVVRLFGVKDG